MAFIWIDKKDGEDFILASDINGIANELINVGTDSAKKDLSNVDNETFKAKAEEAGVGGDNAELFGDAPMVFKGVVSELPDVANDGEVYKVVSKSVEKGELVETCTDLYECATITANGIWGYANGTPLVDAVRNAYLETSERPAPVVVESNGNTYTILVDGYHDESNPYIGTVYYIDGVTNVNSEVSFDNAIVYRGIAKEVVKTCVYHNGEWVEL